MKQFHRLLRPAWAAILLSFSLPALAQGLATRPAPRLSGPIGEGTRAVLPGSHPPAVNGAADLGTVAANQPISGITLVLNRSAAQEADLQTLLAGQQNPASPLYHKWLTPDTFATRFGVADADLNAVTAWLQTEGFTVLGVSRGRTRITFSGNAGQVAQAFGAPLHHFNVGGAVHMAPGADLTLPATLAPMVTAVLHLSDFRPRPALKHAAQRPNYTSSKTGEHFLTPVDLATMYDVNAVYNQGFNGAGQSVAIVGQSAIDVTDISRFQTAAGLPSNLPTLVLLPDSGVSARLGDGDEAESDLDLEYSSGMARGAKFFFVYAGDNGDYGSSDAIQYAVDEAIAPVISSSYGACEAAVGSAYANALNEIGEQANSQGQTILAAAGDEGSSDCAGDAGDTSLSTPQLESLSVDLPAALPTVTAMGGTQMTAGASTTGSNTYWTSASGSDVVGSLLSYVPEVVWNENVAGDNLLAGGGGTSSIFARPTWQAGVTGIPAGSLRLVPDLALQASTGNPGYILCTSDASVLADYGITASCSSGFRDASTGYLEAGYGGTSFAAPVMAGLVAVLNQATNSGGQTYAIAGQGNINPTLYSLASNATTYASVFHDITSGNNACVAGAIYNEGDYGITCTSGSTGYSATAGYDEASGLGSFDFAKLVAAWPVATAVTAGRSASTTTVAAAAATVALNASDVITITVASAGAGTATPTGSISLIANGGSAITLQLTNGQATYTLPGIAVSGSYAVAATYSGDTNYLPSSGAVSVTVGTTVTAGTFTLSAQNITVATNNVGSGTVEILPGAGYSGIVNLSVVFPSGAPSLCYALNPAIPTITNGVSASAQSTTLEIGEGTVCTSSSVGPELRSGAKTHAGNQLPAPVSPFKRFPAATAFAGILLAGLSFRRRSRRLSALLSVAVLAVLGFGLSGCGGGTTVTKTITPAAPATYTVTVVGTDSVTSSITSSTTFTLTIN